MNNIHVFPVVAVPSGGFFIDSFGRLAATCVALSKIDVNTCT
jgi:hypothetical protein